MLLFISLVFVFLDRKLLNPEQPLEHDEHVKYVTTHRLKHQQCDKKGYLEHLGQHEDYFQLITSVPVFGESLEVVVI